LSTKTSVVAFEKTLTLPAPPVRARMGCVQPPLEGNMLNSTLRKSLNVVSLLLKALILAILIAWIFDFPVTPVY
jgi:hypothetical protein